MTANKRLLILPGDGIGPEVMVQVRRVIDWFDKRQAVAFDLEEDLVGGAAFDVHGVPLAEATLEKAMAADAVLLGAVGVKVDAVDSGRAIHHRADDLTGLNIDRSRHKL